MTPRLADEEEVVQTHKALEEGRRMLTKDDSEMNPYNPNRNHEENLKLFKSVYDNKRP